MTVNRPVKITRNQLNIEELNTSPKKLLEHIKSELTGWDYDADDIKYKYKGEGDEVDQVQFIVYGEKDVDNYTRFIITIEVTIEDAVLYKAEDKTVINGEGKIILKSELLFDYDDIWSKDPILHFLKGVYEKYIYHDTRKKHETKIAKEMFNLKDDLKGFVKER